MYRKHLFGTTIAMLALLASATTEARSPYAGRYRIANGPDTAGELELGADGHFRYAHSEGALDEHAEGTWVETGGDIRLTTAPKPVPPSFARGPDGAPNGDGDAPTIHVRLADGRDLAGVDFRLGLTNGTSLAGYTQAEGWSFAEPGAKTGKPRIAWVEVVEPIYGVVSPRFAIDLPGARYSPRIARPSPYSVSSNTTGRSGIRSWPCSARRPIPRSTSSIAWPLPNQVPTHRRRTRF